MNGNGDEKQIKRKKDFNIVASESGWPSKAGFHHHYHEHDLIQELEYKCGNELLGSRLPALSDPALCGILRRSFKLPAASVENARIFYKNLMKHVMRKGTPLVGKKGIETYLFAMFDENQKPGDVSERHYGLFSPTQVPKYGHHLHFCGC